MSVFKQKNAIAFAEFKGFEGIDGTAKHSSVSSASDMVNFRVLEDGSLEKRCGFAPIAICQSKIRAVWSGKLDERQATFIVYDKKVAAVDTVNKSIVYLGSLVSSEGHVNFILFNARLYLIDSNFIYHVSHNYFRVVEGYAPLYGKNWTSATVGTVNEPLNLASRHIRMTYTVTEKLIYLRVVHRISSIDAVFINGVQVQSSRYYYDESLMCVCVLSLSVGDHVELFLTIAQSEIDYARVFSCKNSVVYGTYADSRLFLWGGNEEDLVLMSKPLDDGSFEQTTSVYEDSVPLYIPKDSSFTLSKEGRRITAICRHYDRLLIFTNADTWMAKTLLESDNPFDAISVNPSNGCTSNGAVVLCGNDPICVSDGNILRFTSKTDELNESNAYSISRKINSLLTPSFFLNAKILIDRHRSEIFFFDPNDENGTLWIYNLNTDNWFKFDGIHADHIFLCDHQLGFVRDNVVYLFDDDLEYDVMEDGSHRDITAFFESLPMDLSIAGNKKRLCGMTLNANLSGGAIKAEYISKGKIIGSMNLESESTYPLSFIKRLNSSRFCYITLRLTSDSGKKQRIYSTSVCAKA